MVRRKLVMLATKWRDAAAAVVMRTPRSCRQPPLARRRRSNHYHHHHHHHRHSKLFVRPLSSGLSTDAAPSLSELRVSRAKDIAKLPEVVQTEKMLRQLREATAIEALSSDGKYPDLGGATPNAKCVMEREDYLTCMRAAFATQLLHTEARTASLLGHGFYTIGPCGEELLSSVGVALSQTDAMALHYRHLGTQIARQLGPGQGR